MKLTRKSLVCLSAPLLTVTLAAPPRTMGLLYCDSAAASPGYTLFAPMTYNVTYLIDNNGMLVHSWQGARRPGLSVSLCEDGQLLRTCEMANPVFISGGAGGMVELVDWGGNVAWSWVCSSPQYCQHHDALRMPDGDILMVAWEYRSRTEAIAFGRNPALCPGSLWPDHLVEVDPDGDSVVWEWHVWDHLVQDYDSTKPNYGHPQAHPELIDLNFAQALVSDWQHSNSVSYNQDLDQVAMSVRDFSEVWIIDHGTTTQEAAGHAGGRYGRGGDLLYRWGNPAAYRRGGPVGRTLFQQHDAQWIPESLPGAGHMLVFNNGVGRDTTYSSVDEFVPPTDSAGFYHLGLDSAYGPTAPVWQYTAVPPESLFSNYLSGCQRLPNGNTLICAGPQGTFMEVTSEGRLVWKYVNPVTYGGPAQQGEVIEPGANQLFRVRRYSPDYPGLEGRNLEPQGPIERYPPAVGEAGLSGSRQRLCPVVVCSQLSISGSFSARLLDIDGREVIRLRPGSNDIGSVAPGVYFVRAGASPQTDRVVIQR